MAKKFVDTRYAKTKEYRKVLDRIADKKICPYCPRNFKFHKNSILIRSGGWFITRNSWPYPKSKHHFLIIGDNHKEKVRSLSLEDLHHIFRLIKLTVYRFKIKGGAIAMRFGDTSYTGATVSHLHLHLIVPELNKNKKAKTVMFPIG